MKTLVDMQQQLIAILHQPQMVAVVIVVGVVLIAVAFIVTCFKR